MLEIVSMNQVDKRLEESLYDLERACHQVDKTHRFTYFSNRYQFNLSMPWLFVAYQEGEIVGFISLYIESPLVAEVTLKVLPRVRRQGIGSALIRHSQEVMRTYGVKNEVYVTENGFWSDKQVWRKQFYEDQEFEQEILMTYAGLPDVRRESHLLMSEVEEEDVNWLRENKVEAFGGEGEEMEQFIRQTMSDPMAKLLIFRNQSGQRVGSLALDFSGPQNYIFSFFSAKAYRGQGYGKQMIEQVVTYAKKINDDLIQLQVERHNQRALSVYQALGFKEVSRVESVVLSPTCGLPK